MPPRGDEDHGDTEGRAEAKPAPQPDIAGRRRQRAFAIQDDDQHADHAEEDGQPGAQRKPFGKHGDAKRGSDQRCRRKRGHDNGDRGFHGRKIEGEGVEEIGKDNDKGRAAEQRRDLRPGPRRAFKGDPQHKHADADQKAAPEGQPPAFKPRQPDEKRIRCDDQGAGKRHHQAKDGARRTACQDRGCHGAARRQPKKSVRAASVSCGASSAQ